MIRALLLHKPKTITLTMKTANREITETLEAAYADKAGYNYLDEQRRKLLSVYIRRVKRKGEIVRTYRIENKTTKELVVLYIAENHSTISLTEFYALALCFAGREDNPDFSGGRITPPYVWPTLDPDSHTYAAEIMAEDRRYEWETLYEYLAKIAETMTDGRYIVNHTQCCKLADALCIELPENSPLLPLI